MRDHPFKKSSVTSVSSVVNLLTRTLAIAFSLFGVDAFHTFIAAIAGLLQRFGRQRAAQSLVGLKEIHGYSFNFRFTAEDAEDVEKISIDRRLDQGGRSVPFSL
jgi:hypothetical protein